jgi:ribosomal protein S18 acetylase RimI-like enzyme
MAVLPACPYGFNCMLEFASPTPEQYDLFLQWMWDDGQEYMVRTMRLMNMTWDEYSQIFRTRGEVYSICQDTDLAGFYWIEQRGDTLHLHGLILMPAFQGKGIGTSVLTMLEKKFSGKVDKIELGVYQENSRAISLYQRNGYQVTQTLDDLHFLIMQKQLTPIPYKDL